MKKTLRCLLSVALILTMLLSMVGAVSAAPAEPETVETVGDLLQPTKNGAAGTPVRDAGQWQWNELLGEAPESFDTKKNNAVAATTTPPDKGLIFNDDTELETVLSYMRAQMKARKASVAVTYETKDFYDYSAFAEALFQAAIAHTGVGNEGDYLRWLWRSRSRHVYGTQGVYLTYTFKLTYLTTAAQEQQMDTAVASLLRQLNLNGLTNYKKVRKIYDWICANVTYDHTGLKQGIDNSPLTWTPYKALLQGTSVCQGYALLFYRLALESGVDNRFIGGKGDGGDHGWNIVRLGGKYYNLDATWDAGKTSYQWFLLTDGNFVRHVRDADYLTADFYKAYPMGATNYNPNVTIPGDMNGDGELTTNDAVYLLLHIMFGAEDYPLAV